MKTKTRGFTLIELMIAVAILGLLSSVAVPSYLSYIQKGKRAEAQGALVTFANAMEQWRLQNGSYCDAGGAGGANSCGAAGTNDTGSPAIFSKVVPISGGTITYDLTISAATIGTAAVAAVPADPVAGTPEVPAAAATPPGYTLRATPTGSQAADGYLELKSDGTKTCEKTSACLNGSSW